VDGVKTTGGKGNSFAMAAAIGEKAAAGGGANDFTPSKFGYEAGRVCKSNYISYKTQPMI
jgi:hypothetical protein